MCACVRARVSSEEVYVNDYNSVHVGLHSLFVHSESRVFKRTSLLCVGDSEFKCMWLMRPLKGLLDKVLWIL